MIKSKRITLLFILSVFFCSLKSYSAVCTSTGSGDWANAATWSCGSVPTCGDSIIIEAGHTVTITNQQDYTGCAQPLKISIKGVLKFTTGNKLRLPCDSKIYIFPGGSIQPGGGGGGSNQIEVCGDEYWRASDGPVSGPSCMPPSPCPGNLPVELSSFTATVNGSIVELLWTTLSEKNNKQFDVERSADAVFFKTALTVPSKAPGGNSTRSLSYTGVDLEPMQNTSYYRLKQIDLDNTFHYSNILAVTLVKDKNIKFVIYPNPNQGEFTADISGVENNHQVTILLTDFSGRAVYKSDFFIQDSAGSKFSIIPENKLLKGVYTCSLIIEEISFNVKVVVN